jgi:uncharacterized membrane protein
MVPSLLPVPVGIIEVAAALGALGSAAAASAVWAAPAMDRAKTSVGRNRTSLLVIEFLVLLGKLCLAGSGISKKERFKTDSCPHSQHLDLRYL